MQTRNKFTPTGHEKLDRAIDLLLDNLKHGNRRQQGFAASEIQGVRTVLTTLHLGKYDETIFELAELITKHYSQFEDEPGVHPLERLS